MTSANLQAELPIRAFAYIRCSGTSQMDKDGPIRQRAAIAAYCSEHSIEIADEYLEAFTGTDLEGRPEFRDMRSALLSNGVRTVVVEKLDRVARSVMVQEKIIEDFQRHGITLLSATAGEEDLCGDDPTRIFIRQVLAAVAQFDRSTLVSRMKAGKARARANGKRCGGRASYGNHKAHPEERAVIDRVNHLQRHGFNASKIADLLNSEGLLTRKGTRFRAMQVSRILSRTQKITGEIL